MAEMELRDATQEDIVFWKSFLNVGSDGVGKHYDEEGIEIYGMTDQLFAEQCIFYEEWLKLDDELFREYYRTEWLNMFYVPYVVKLRFYASFAAAG